jgi:hypothetical protein
MKCFRKVAIRETGSEAAFPQPVGEIRLTPGADQKTPIKEMILCSEEFFIAVIH